MEWWPIIRIIWGGMGFALTCLILIVVWRGRSVIAWNRAIRKELRSLAVEAERAMPARKEAIGLIIGECDAIFRSLSPEGAVGLERLHRFIRSVAACFFPEAERPELQISLGHLIRSLDASLFRFDQILHRPGLRRIQSVNIKTLRGLYRWSDELLKHSWAKWVAVHRTGIQRLAMFRLVILPDPFSWILFLSRKLLVLVVMKILLVDITLFLGKLALASFGGSDNGPVEENSEALEATLQGLAQVEITPIAEPDPAIVAMRQKLVGFPAIMFSTPTWRSWKTAIRDAAEIIARRHFPDSDKPLEEAAIGPLLDRARSYLGTLGKGDRVILVRTIYTMRLETVFQARDITDLVLSTTVRGIIRSTVVAYGWLKWPLKIYRRIKRFSLPGIAMDLGWVLGKKSAVALICGRTFDHACRELDGLYRASAAMKRTGATRRPPIDGVGGALPPADEKPMDAD